MQTIVDMGADKSKLVMGIPLYGQSFTLKSPSMHGVGAPTIWPGDAGELTQQPGMLATYEICNRCKNYNFFIPNDIVSIPLLTQSRE